MSKNDNNESTNPFPELTQNRKHNDELTYGLAQEVASNFTDKWSCNDQMTAELQAKIEDAIYQYEQRRKPDVKDL